MPNYSQEHAVPVPLTLTLSVLERGRRIILKKNIYIYYIVLHSLFYSGEGSAVSGAFFDENEHFSTFFMCFLEND